MAYKLWTPEEETLLKDLVSTGLYSYRDMEKFFPGRTLSSLTKHARIYLNIHNNIYKQHKYTYTKGFFATPNILNSYVAGFWAADGCVRLIPPASPVLRLDLGTEDLEYLKTMKDLLGYTGIITPTKRKKSTTHYFQMTVSDEYRLDLERNFGIIPRKTKHLSPPNLPSLDMKIAFLIGLLDGDGCVHLNYRNSLSIGYTSCSRRAVEWYEMVMKLLNLPSIQRNTKIPKIRELTHAKAFFLAYSGARAVAFVKLVQSFAAHYNLPILRRKWDTSELNAYIRRFEYHYPQFSYTPPVFPTIPVPETVPSVAA